MYVMGESHRPDAWGKEEIGSLVAAVNACI